MFHPRPLHCLRGSEIRSRPWRVLLPPVVAVMADYDAVRARLCLVILSEIKFNGYILFIVVEGWCRLMKEECFFLFNKY